MDLGDVIYSWNRLEEGGQYIAFSFNNPTVPLWQGHLVLRSNDNELMVIRQTDDSLAVVWASHLPDGVRSIFHELPGQPFPRVPILPLSKRQAREAALVLLRRTAEQSDEPYTALLYPCGDSDSWHYTEEPDLVLDVVELRHYIGERGKTLAQVTRSLMERAGMLCEHTSNS